MSDLTLKRERMVERHIARRGVSDPRVLDAMRRVPRHRFVPEHLVAQAYRDNALPIGSEQTISQPFVVARMSELLAVEPEHTVLEIGSGSGYQTAILGLLARRVYSLERISALARQAIARLSEMGLDNVKVQTFDGTVGWSEFAPYDRILVTAGAPAPPPPLLDQLALGGRLVIPEGDREAQRLVVYDRQQSGVRRWLGEEVAFVPLIGRHGWAGEE